MPMLAGLEFRGQMSGNSIIKMDIMNILTQSGLP